MATDLNTFSSFYDFIKRFISIFRGPSFITAYKTMDPKFREKILITISMTNNCAG